mmetsp:Transcript_17066/g.47941  ORF Transcript_17066/g.47941 Transcript_17066/m.47941 type:complete len:222 (-) Transcript_17066:201-866(-)
MLLSLSLPSLSSMPSSSASLSRSFASSLPVARKTCSRVVNSTSMFAASSCSSHLSNRGNDGSVPCAKSQVRVPGLSERVWRASRMTRDTSRSVWESKRNEYPAPKWCLRNSVLPHAMICPFFKIATLSLSKSTSSKWCEHKMMLLPALASIIMSQIVRRLYGSIPAVGSSRKTTSGFPSKAMAMHTFRFMPPEYVFTGLSASSGDVKPICSMRRSTSASMA